MARIPAALEEYAVHLEAQAKTPKTIRTYMTILETVQAHLDRPLSKLDQASANRAVVAMAHKGYSENTVNLAKNAIKSYAAWAGIPLALRTRKAVLREKTVPAPYLICKAADRSGSRSTCAMIYTLYSSGVRLRELVGDEVNNSPGVQVQDIDLAHHSFQVVGKGRRLETAYLVLETMRAEKAIERWMEELHRRKGGLFPFSPSYVQAEVARAGQIVGVRLHPHLLRHACATHLGEKTGDVMLVNRILRHRSVQTTMRYVHVDREKIERFIRKEY